ncbi:dephospho-CoA kinase [Kineococcus sp. G2]|uniref:dephospho-CoA kinase n=1 Tax=Kineococcus sp. G2 TaxID=3127484 RepID=UPI00301DA5B3
MLRVGLTGGIGAGKSTVAKHLVALGAFLVDADVLAREVVAPGTGGLRAVVELFGPGVLREDGQLDRAALGRLVFSDPGARRALNAVVHPRVAARREELVAAAPPDAVVVEDVPLLVETGAAARFALVVLVHADVDERVRRLVSDRGMDPRDAHARVAAQASDEERAAVADVVLDNPRCEERASGRLRGQVERVWRERLVPFEENVRRGRPAPVPPAGPSAPDPSWPAQAARLAARAAHAAGELQRGVEHVGPTAVPGTVAEDVLDLQLAVPSREALDRVAGALAAVGYPRAGTEQPGDGADGRLHGSADPGRAARLHVRVHGSAPWRRALLVRDWRRAGGDPRTVGEECVEPLAEDWARRTGWHPPAP